VAHGGGREHIPWRRQRRKNHVNVVHAIGKVNSAGTDIARVKESVEVSSRATPRFHCMT
jgi:hypothetical protein